MACQDGQRMAVPPCSPRQTHLLPGLLQVNLLTATAASQCWRRGRQRNL